MSQESKDTIKEIVGSIGCGVFVLLGLVGLLLLVYFIIDGLLWSFTFTNWVRFIIAIPLIALYCFCLIFLTKTELAESYSKSHWRKPIIIARWVMIIVIIMIIGQWFLLGQVHTSAIRDSYELKTGSKAQLPLFGSYAHYTGKSILVRRSFFSPQTTIDVSDNDPKAISFNLTGDRLVVRFHRSAYPGGNGRGTRVFFKTYNGEKVGRSSSEKGYWHSRLHLVL